MTKSDSPLNFNREEINMPKREKNEWANQMVAVQNAIRMLSRPQGASNEELIEELGVKLRSVQRLKRTLDKQFHLPQEEVFGIEEKARRWRIMDTASLSMPNVKKIGLNTAELLALYILRGVAGIYKGSTIMDDINSEQLISLHTFRSNVLAKKHKISVC
jgi:hypothetical protein